MAELESTGVLKLELSGVTAELTKDDLLIDSAQTSGFESLSDRGVTVVMDTNLTEELIEEGFVREIVSKIQTMRKESKFEVMDNIRIYIGNNAKIEAIAAKNAESIKSDVLGVEIIFNEECANKKEWNLNGEDVTLGVEKV